MGGSRGGGRGRSRLWRQSTSGGGGNGVAVPYLSPLSPDPRPPPTAPRSPNPPLPSTTTTIGVRPPPSPHPRGRVPRTVPLLSQATVEPRQSELPRMQSLPHGKRGVRKVKRSLKRAGGATTPPVYAILPSSRFSGKRSLQRKRGRELEAAELRSSGRSGEERTRTTANGQVHATPTPDHCPPACLISWP
jgi:hypothetical protein